MTFAGAWDRVEGGHGNALLLAIAVPALLIALGFVLLIVRDESLGAQVAVFLAALVFVVPVIAIAVFVIGLPLTWLLARWRLERIWTYPAAGFVAGATLVVFVPYLTGDTRTGASLEFLPFALIGALPGALSGAIWWWAHRRYVQAKGDAA